MPSSPCSLCQCFKMTPTHLGVASADLCFGFVADAWVWCGGGVEEDLREKHPKSSRCQREKRLLRWRRQRRSVESLSGKFNLNNFAFSKLQTRNDSSLTDRCVDRLPRVSFGDVKRRPLSPHHATLTTTVPVSHAATSQRRLLLSTRATIMTSEQLPAMACCLQEQQEA